MDAPLALYRRYRPETFAEMIGQEHVTEPLRHALAGNRVHHAYLFSGPRGCGKTTTARILARTLNCERAPVAEPCGQCQSCRDLARGGPGSVDVIEIDAASHGGVDDARDLRERAFFAPVASPYKVYIIDEAHMVSPQGFNALLKLVEEPPPHLKFVFATTEPDKVIGTIRSRTHHYPIRLVPPKVLGEYLAELCRREEVQLEPTALPLVVRAGGGSVRDTLSVLDQLLGGAGEAGLTYDLAVQLLGYTPDSLLDEVVDALAAADGGTVFGVVDKVIESGQDPRRFAEDLLQRLRDLIVVAAVPDAVDIGVLEAPGDRAERLAAQANGFGPSQLTRAADIVNEALVEFRGATAPRLLLELMCARILVPTADHSARGFAARLERLERRLGIPADGVVASSTPPMEPVETTQPEVAPTSSTTVEPSTPAHEPSTPVVEPVDTAQPEVVATGSTTDVATSSTNQAPGSLGVTDVRRLWPQILDLVKEKRRFTWIMLSQNAQVAALDGDVLTLALVNAGARDAFVNSGSADVLAEALQEELGVVWRIESIIDPGRADAASPSAEAAPDAPAEPRGVGAPSSVREAVTEPRRPPEPEPAPEPDDGATADDPVVETVDDPEELLSRELGARVIDDDPPR